MVSLASIVAVNTKTAKMIAIRDSTNGVSKNDRANMPKSCRMPITSIISVSLRL